MEYLQFLPQLSLFGWLYTAGTTAILSSICLDLKAYDDQNRKLEHISGNFLLGGALLLGVTFVMQIFSN